MSAQSFSSTLQPRPTLKLWTPGPISVMAYFLGFPTGIILATINWMRMGLRGNVVLLTQA